MRTRLFTGCLMVMLLVERRVAADERMVVDLFINGQRRGEAVVISTDTGWLLNQDAWTLARLPDLGGRHEIRSGVEFLALASVPAITSVAVDSTAQTARLQIDPRVLPLTTLDLSERAPAGTRRSRNASGFMNYAVQASDRGRAQVVTESGISLRGVLLTTVATWDGQWVERGQTQMIIDSRRSLTRWTLGDSFAFGGPVGSAVALGGISVAREFAIDPYFSRFTTTSITGATATPSSIEVYNNGRLVRRDAVAAGPYAVVNSPREPGTGTTRIVVRDAFGAEQVWTSQFYQGVSTLPRGLQEFHYAAGLERITNDAGQMVYARPAFLASHRWGVSDSVTLGFGAEARQQLQNGGPTLSAQFPFGELELSARASRASDGYVGFAETIAYAYQRRNFSIGGRARAVDEGYETLDADRRPDRIRTDATAYVAVPLGSRRSLQLQHSWIEPWHAEPLVRTTATFSHPVGSRTVLSASATRIRESRTPAYEAFAGLTLLLGSRSAASVTHTSGRNRDVTTATIQRSLPTANGVGYQLQVQDKDRAYGRLEYQNGVGRYAVSSDVAGGVQRTSFNLSGAVSLIGGGFHLSRPIRDAFGLVDLGGLDGVTIMVGNAPVGTTRRGGRLLIPNLLSYHANDVSIAQEDVPLEWDVPSRKTLIAPGLRNGAIIHLAARMVRVVTGRVRLLDQGLPVPAAFATLAMQVSGQTLESPLGSDGEFYLENVPPGAYRASVTTDTLSATCRVVVPASRTSVVYVDDVVCAVTR